MGNFIRVLRATIFASQSFRPVSYSGLVVPVKIGLRVRVPLYTSFFGRILSEKFIELFLVILYLCLLALFVSVARPQFLIGRAVLQHVIDDFQHFRRYCDQCALLAPTGGEPLITCREVGILCSCSTPRTFSHYCLRSLVPVVGV